MSNRKKNVIYSLILFLLFVIIYFYRNTTLQHEVYLRGETMGSIPYNIRYISSSQISFQKSIDSLLKIFNASMSTYITDSEISTFNKSENGIAFKNYFFYPLLETTSLIETLTDGAFDPTVMPLVNYWGFGPSTKKPEVLHPPDTLLTHVGWNLIQYTQDSVLKKHKKVELDFSGIAKGYAVDLVTYLLENKGIHNYMVEIGGEVRCKGYNKQNKYWRIGIQNPSFEQTDVAHRVVIKNRALATSGNYRKFYTVDGKKYAHTIDPKTGYPVTHNLLSVSILAPDCITADALATAIMVLGEDKGRAIIENNLDWDAIFISEKEGKLESVFTKNIQEIIK